MRSLFGYQRGGPVGRGEPQSYPGPRGEEDAMMPLPPGVKPGGRYFTDPITGNMMYQPPMPDVGPGQMQAMVMPPAIDLTTGQPKPIQNLFDFNQPPPQTDPVQDAVDQATGGNLAQEIMAYLGGDQAGVYREDYDIDGDGEISIRDSIYQMQTEGGLRNPDGTPVTEADPVQTAVDQATGGVTAQDIMAYLGETGPFMEGMDINKDGTVDQLDSVWQLQIQEGLRNPDGTPIAQPDPVQTAVDAATGTKPLPSSYGAVDNWGEPGYTAYDPADQFIDPVTSFVEDPVSPFMDEDPSTDTWTAPVFDVLETAGAGAGGDPTTDFAPVNNLFEPTTGDPYPVGIIDPNATDPVIGTGTDPNAPGPDPTFFDYDAGTYTDPSVVDTTDAVDDMTVTTGVFPANPAENQQYTDTNGVTWIFVQGQWIKVGAANVGPGTGGGPGSTTGGTTTGGFPANPFEGMVHIDANNVTWTFVQGQWVEVVPTTGDPTVTDPTVTDPTVTDPTVTDPTVTDPTVTPTVTDPTVTDPTVTDPTVTDPTVTDPTVTGQSEVDKLNALVAELRAKQEAERAAWEAQTAAATGKYTLTGPSIGYNPYVSGQYQSDPYGAAGVPDLGGLTTIPTPAPWQPPTLQPWQPPTSTSNPWGK